MKSQLSNILTQSVGLLLAILCSFGLSAQTEVKLSQYGRYDSIPVYSVDGQMHVPWSGGMETPQFSPINLNGDTLLDMVYFDREGFFPRTYINTGKAGREAYRYAPEYEPGFPKVWDYVLFRDFDNDGLEDIFTASDVGDFRVFKNVSDTKDPDSTKFELQLFPAHWDSTFMYFDLTAKYYAQGLSKPYFYTNVYCSGPDIPGVWDADGDGDLDILTFDIPQFQFYRNMQVENGSNKALDLMLYDLCWGQLTEGSLGFSLDLNSCFGIVPPSAGPGHSTGRGGSRHLPTKTILWQDLNCNGQADLLLGDQGFTNMIIGYNTGTQDTAHVTSQDTSFPSNDVPVDVNSFPAAYYIDADNDGKKDLLVAPNDIVGYSNVGQVKMYKNQGTDACPDLKFQFDAFLEKDLIDLGQDAYPNFFNVDGDSLMDIVVGGYGVYQPALGTFDSRLAYFKNIGTTTAPEFTLVTRDLIPTPNPIDTGLSPSFGDLDADGDQDMLLATANGHLYYYENQAATPQDSAEFVLTSTSFGGQSFGQNPRLYLYDVDEDGKLDLLLGDRRTFIRYYRNTGTAQVANFSPSVVDSTFGGIQHADEWGRGRLTIAIKDLDTNGVESSDTNDTSVKRFVYVGSTTGWIYLYDQFSSTPGSNFRLIDSLFVYSRSPSIFVGDITGDNKPDMLFGHHTGGLSMLLKDGGNIIPPPPDPGDDTTSIAEWEDENGSSLKLYPNPGQSELFIQNPENETIENLSFFDLSGKQVQQVSLPGNGPINVADLPQGAYVVRIKTETGLVSLPYFKAVD